MIYEFKSIKYNIQFDIIRYNNNKNYLQIEINNKIIIVFVKSKKLYYGRNIFRVT